MNLSHLSLNLYRRTVKRFRSAHVATHWLMTHLVIPVLQAVTGFHTMPDDPFWFRLELLTRRHESETVRQLDRLVQPGMVLLDIGAHVGYYACRYAPLIGKNGRILAFEPHPRTFATLSQNVKRFGNVTAVPVALADAEGTAELHDYLMMSASGSLHYDQSLAEQQQARVSDSDIAPRIGQKFAAQTYRVRTTAVDTYLDEMGINTVNLVKMDIEGAEIGALRGMRQTIARSPHLILVMEYNPQALQASGHQPQAALAEVLALGFNRMQAIESSGELTDLTGQAGRIEALTQLLMANMGVVNLLFSKA